MLNIPPDLEQVLDNIHDAGFDVWLVGGAIRDHVLGWPPHDWDIATNASPEEMGRLHPRVAPIGIRHGTVQVHNGVRTVEVTSYKGHGVEAILADLGRRDFTVNALALSYPGKELLDPFGGQKDLQAGVLKAVGDARARFREDPLRTLRAGRFVSVYGFSISQDTFEALKVHAAGLRFVAAERIREEVFKLILGEKVFEAFEWMRKGGALQHFFPEILDGYDEEAEKTGQDDVYSHLLGSVQWSPKRLRVRLAALFHDLAEPRTRLIAAVGRRYPDHRLESASLASEVLMRWRASRKLTQQVVQLVKGHISIRTHEWSGAQIRRMMFEAGTELLDDLLDLASADRLSAGAGAGDLEEIAALRRCVHLELQSGAPLHFRDLAVNGEDLMGALGLSSGPVVGKILQKLHERVLDEPAINRREILLDLAQKVYSTEQFRP